MINVGFLREMDLLTLGIISSLIATGIIAIVLFLLKNITNFSRVREFWGRYTREFTLFSGQIYFREHHHRYMAAGDIRAILSIALTIQSIFKLKRIPHRFSNATIPNEDLRGNILSVGGSKFNYVTRSIVDKYNDSIANFPVKFEGNKIIIKWTDAKEEKKVKEVEYKKEEDRVTEDYGLLIRGINPFDDTCTSISWVIAGSGSNGCQASAEQLSKFIYGSKLRLRRHRNYLVRGEVGLIVVRANFLEGEYASSTPIFYASYQKVRTFPIFGKKEKKWVYYDKEEKQPFAADSSQSFGLVGAIALT